MTDTRRRVVYTPLDEILRAFRNPKMHDKDMIAGSVSRFGIVELPTVDGRTGRLVAGHGRLDDWTERRAAGEIAPEGVEVDDNGRWLVPVVHGWSSRSDADAEAYVVLSNQTTIAGGWDNANLAQLLADLRDQDPALLALTGFDEAFIAKHWVEDPDPWDNAVPVGTGEGDPEPETAGQPHTCPSCGHQWAGDCEPGGTT